MKNLPKLKLGQVGILLLAAMCAGVFIYDLLNAELDGSLPAEAPVVAVLNPNVLPEPEPEPMQEVFAQPKEEPAEDDFYAEYRLQREQVRGEELELLQAVLDDEKASQDLRDKAHQRKLQIAQNMEYELMTEKVLYAKSFGETAVMLGADTATVVLSGLFDEIKAAQVAEAVAGVTGIAYENIIIINR